MQSVCNEAHTHLIGSDGGLRHVPSVLAPALLQQGFREVVRPKRTYYPEYDKTSASYREQELIDVNEDTDVLVVEVL